MITEEIRYECGQFGLWLVVTGPNGIRAVTRSAEAGCEPEGSLQLVPRPGKGQVTHLTAMAHSFDSGGQRTEAPGQQGKGHRIVTMGRRLDVAL
jgi:hypothetical protein